MNTTYSICESDFAIKELEEKIIELQQKLTKMHEENNNVITPEIMELSKELDGYIVQEQRERLARLNSQF